jgi:hypothetical protein
LIFPYRFDTPFLNDRLVSRCARERDEPIVLPLIFIHLFERRRVCVDADRRRERYVANVVCVIGAESTDMAYTQGMGRFAWALLFQKTGCNHECTGGVAVIMKSRGLPGQPADDPDVVVGSAIDALIPAVVSA